MYLYLLSGGLDPSKVTERDTFSEEEASYCCD